MCADRNDLGIVEQLVTRRERLKAQDVLGIDGKKSPGTPRLRLSPGDSYLIRFLWFPVELSETSRSVPWVPIERHWWFGNSVVCGHGIPAKLGGDEGAECPVCDLAEEWTYPDEDGLLGIARSIGQKRDYEFLVLVYEKCHDGGEFRSTVTDYPRPQRLNLSLRSFGQLWEILQRDRKDVFDFDTGNDFVITKNADGTVDISLGDEISAFADIDGFDREILNQMIEDFPPVDLTVPSQDTLTEFAERIRRGGGHHPTEGRAEVLRGLLPDAVLLRARWGEKGCPTQEWQKTPPSVMDDPVYVSKLDRGNICVLLGRGLCAIDIDVDGELEEFLALNPQLENTMRVRGERGCKLIVHIVGDYPDNAKFKFDDGKVWGDWLADSHLACLSGLHPSGCMYQFEVEHPPVEVAFDEIQLPDGVNFVASKGKKKGTTQANERPHQGGQGSEFPDDWDDVYEGMDLDTLENVNRRPDKIIARCPACADEGGDSKGEHLVIFPDGRFGCAANQGDSEHRLRILELARPDKPQFFLPGGPIPIRDAAFKLFGLIAPSKKMFFRGGAVCVISTNEDGGKKFDILNPAAMRSRIEKHVRLVRLVKGKKGETQTVPSICPTDTAKAWLESEAAKVLLPNIRNLINCPILALDGGQLRVVGPGYDPQTKLFVTGGAMPVEVPLEEAVAAIKRLLADWDFQTEGDLSRAIAAILTPVLRFGGFIMGNIPAALNEADQSQSGKTYQVEVRAAIFKESLALITQRKGGVGSMDESINSGLVAGRPFIAFDNLRGRLDSTHLEALLTQQEAFPCRIPGKPEITVDPKGFIFAMTSNGMEITRDLANRVSIIRIRKRVGYDYKMFPEGDLLAHVRANQPYYLGAVFAVIREWHARGMPTTNEMRHDFRDWCRKLDWIVQHIMGCAPLMEGHEAAQAEVSNPALVFARSIALAVDQHGRLREDLRATEIFDLAEEEEIVIPGDKSGGDSEKGAKKIGTLMKKVFKDNDSVDVDGYQIKRVIQKEKRGDGQGYFEVKTYSITKSD